MGLDHSRQKGNSKHRSISNFIALSIAIGHGFLLIRVVLLKHSIERTKTLSQRHPLSSQYIGKAGSLSQDYIFRRLHSEVLTRLICLEHPHSRSLERHKSLFSSQFIGRALMRECMRCFHEPVDFFKQQAWSEKISLYFFFDFRILLALMPRDR